MCCGCSCPMHCSSCCAMGPNTRGLPSPSFAYAHTVFARFWGEHSAVRAATCSATACSTPGSCHRKEARAYTELASPWESYSAVLVFRCPQRKVTACFQRAVFEAKGFSRLRRRASLVSAWDTCTGESSPLLWWTAVTTWCTAVHPKIQLAILELFQSLLRPCGCPLCAERGPFFGPGLASPSGQRSLSIQSCRALAASASASPPTAAGVRFTASSCPA
mmetsp:Transcript_38620/g.109217  ORF Transcript_38620/g.109217 Transcript_38620/m.109217 type:complete len:219 (+) Transcript_38620:273-929(+)